MPRQNQTPTMTISQSSSYNATWIVYSLAVLVWPALALSGAELDLVKNGEPHATIVLAQRPTASAQLAAWEHQY